MTDKVYETSEHYKRAAAGLIDFIGKRDALAATVKTVPPEFVREGQRVLAGMDKEIEKAEAALELEYKTIQTLGLANEVHDALLDKLVINAEKFFINAKRKMPPEQFKEFEADILSRYDPDELQDFYDRIALREAAQPDEIPGENKNNE